MVRTEQQNKAIHVFYKLLADELNDAGLDLRRVLKPEIDIPWTAKTVKEYLWRPIQKTQLGKISTKDLEKSEIDKIYNTLNRYLGEKFGIHIPFPNYQNKSLDEGGQNVKNIKTTS